MLSASTSPCACSPENTCIKAANTPASPLAAAEARNPEDARDMRTHVLGSVRRMPLLLDVASFCASKATRNMALLIVLQFTA